MMRVTAFVDTKSTDDKKIVVRKTMAPQSQKQQHKAGTVLMTDVQVGGNLKGNLIEEHEKQISPRKAIAEWNRLRYVTSKGGYVDATTGEPVERAKAVYMVGTKAFYTP